MYKIYYRQFPFRIPNLFQRRKVFIASEGEICLKSQMPEQILNCILSHL